MYRRSIIFLTLFILIAGCAKKKIPVETIVSPEPEEVVETVDSTLKEKAQQAINQAEIDITEAVNSGAEDYAGELLADAREMLASAKGAFEEEDFSKAIENATKASDLANEAKAVTVEKIEKARKAKKEEQERLRRLEIEAQTKKERGREARLREERERMMRERKEAELRKRDEELQKELEEKMAAEKLAKKKRIQAIIVFAVLILIGSSILYYVNIRKRKPKK